jgi:peptide subunit release factor 1 (eRF1)
LLIPESHLSLFHQFTERMRKMQADYIMQKLGNSILADFGSDGVLAAFKARHVEKVLSEINLNADGFQLCPKCAGSGYVNPGMMSTSSQDQCPVCRGQMIISKATGLPPM